MLISTKGRYALRVLVDIAEHPSDGFIPLKEIADRQEQVNTALEDHQQAVQALEICRRKGEDLKPERDYIGFLLRLHFEEVLTHIFSALTESRDALKEKEAAKTETDKKKIRKRQLHGKQEDRFHGAYGRQLSRSLDVENPHHCSMHSA